MHSVKREDIVLEYLNNIDTTTLESAINKIVVNHQQTHGHNKVIKESMKKSLIADFNRRWKKSYRTRHTFLNNNKKWLATEIVLVSLDDETNNENEAVDDAVHDVRDVGSSSGNLGRPVSPFSESSESTKRRKTRHIRDNNSSEVLCYASQMKLRKEGKCAAANVCAQVTSSPEKAVDILDKSNQTKESVFSPVEALNVLVRTDMSKDNYLFLRQAHRDKGCFMYPPYEQVLCEKKRCYPDSISVTEFEAKVPLQSVVDHTVMRLLKVQGKAINIYLEKDNMLGTNEKLHLDFVIKYGIDGSGDQALFSMKFDQTKHSDACETSIVSSFICPVRLCVRGSNKVLWQNPAPSSPYYCRPVKLSFKKETADQTRQDVSELKEAIENLVPTVSDTCEVHHKLLLTMVDGKVCQALTETPSAASCYICIRRTNPSGMNNLKKIEEKDVNENALSYGLSPLHLLINTMECILHIGYRMKLKTWMVKGNGNKQIFNAEKTRVCKDLKRDLGLNVDRPAQGSGTTNNGNTARRFLDNSETVSKVTGVDVQLIHRLSILLRTLNSGFDIDSCKYDEYAKETAKLYTQLYNWYYMPVSLHKMLMHGKQIIDTLCISVGHASEEGLEATHKLLRNARQHHTCKHSRIRCNSDLIHWLFVISDPVLAGLRKKSTHKKESLSAEVVALLMSPQV
ncbi:uncharacterized protein LOC143032080 [Oratosquilla oratoria]|uniref:uncharacterized protein LOC143032080 n=1 Tax=Oratosquilla oratoria TaxID=337810 RepID=UPI003F764E6F